MPIGFAYQVVKDIAALAKMKEVDPIEVGPQDLVAMGIVDDGNVDVYRWSRPRNLFARTEAPNASHEIVWVTDKLRRTKRKVVRSNNTGTFDVLIRRTAKCSQSS